MKSLIFVVVVFTCPQMHLCADILHYYSFESDASDAIGSADGSLQNGASVNNGTLVLDGSNDFVEFGEKIVPITGDFTVAFFSKETLPNNLFVEFISQGNSGGPGFYLGLDPNNIIRASDSWLDTGVTYPSDGQFHHIAISVDSTLNESTLYLDGFPVAFAAYAITSGSGGNNTRLGRQFDGFSEYLGGELDELRIYDHALTDSEVAQIAGLGPSVVAPDSVTATRGDFVSGGVADLVASDNMDYSMRRRQADTQSRTEFAVKSTSPTDTPTTLEFTLEGAVFARSNVVQTIELFDYVAQAWELIHSSDAARSPAPDSVATATPTGDLSRFVETGTMCIEARVRYQSDSPRQRFASNTDQAIWTIGQ